MSSRNSITIDEDRLDGGAWTRALDKTDSTARAPLQRTGSWRAFASMIKWMAICQLLIFALANEVDWTYPSRQHPLDSNTLRYRPRVTLEAHIMSKCPDAKDCLRDLVLPAMQEVSDKVDFVLSYIGRNTHDDAAVECMHGPSECLGNIIELCAANLYPDVKIYLGFTNCLTMNYTDIPQKELVQGCALEHAIDFDKIERCLSVDDGAFGLDLLRNSVARSANANVTKSCTIRLNDKVRCIRDGGEWKDCEDGSEPKDLVRDIKTLLKYG